MDTHKDNFLHNFVAKCNLKEVTLNNSRVKVGYKLSWATIFYIFICGLSYVLPLLVVGGYCIYLGYQFFGQNDYSTSNIIFILSGAIIGSIEFPIFILLRVYNKIKNKVVLFDDRGLMLDGEREFLWKEIDRIVDASDVDTSGKKPVRTTKIVFENEQGEVVYALEGNGLALTSEQLLELSHYYLKK